MKPISFTTAVGLSACSVKMLKIFFVALVVGNFMVETVVLPLPSYLRPCKKNSSDFDECVFEQAVAGTPYIVKGDKTYGVPAFTPLELDVIDLSISADLQLRITDAKIYGLEKAVIKSCRFDLDAHTADLEFQTDLLRIVAKYVVDGKILVLPVKGTGDASANGTNLNFHYHFTYKLQNKGGEEFIVPTSEGSVDFTADRMIFRLNNLFSGDKTLGENTNKLLEEEWRLVLDELKPSICRTIIRVASSIVENISAKVPYRYIFP